MNKDMRLRFSPRGTAKALVSAGLLVATLALLPVTAQAASTTQVPAGTTTSFGHGTVSDAKPHRILAGALTPETRRTLQAAMDAEPSPHGT